MINLNYPNLFTYFNYWVSHRSVWAMVYLEKYGLHNMSK
jgi:hypothetical protein